MLPGYVGAKVITTPIQRWARSIVDDPNVNYNDVFQAVFDGRVVVARVEHHNYTTDAQGNPIPGCYKGVTVYDPSTPSAVTQQTAPTNGGLRIVEYLFLTGAIFGTVFSVAKSYYENKYQRAAAEEETRRKVREKIDGIKSNPYTPESQRWPRYELRLVHYRSQRESNWIIRGITFENNIPIPDKENTTAKNRNSAMVKAGEQALKYAADNPRNPNVVRVLDDNGRCIFAVRGHATGPIELEC